MNAYDYTRQIWVDGKEGALVRLAQVEKQIEIVNSERGADYMKSVMHYTGSKITCLVKLNAARAECQAEIEGSQGWKILPDPKLGTKHPLHARRFIATSDARWDEDGQTLEAGKLICTMRDGAPEHADWIAHTPAMLAALELIKRAKRGDAGVTMAGAVEAALAVLKHAKGGAS